MDEFINDQNNFTKKKTEKINQKVSEREKSNMVEAPIPKINEKSRRIVEEKLKENFQQPSFMRLYQKKPKVLNSDNNSKLVNSIIIFRLLTEVITQIE